MRTVYLIGNGFDVNLGLPTKYHDFYIYYLGLDRSGDSPGIIRLKEHMEAHLGKENSYWSDMEAAMGTYTTRLSSYGEMEQVYDNLNDEMQKYIADVEHGDLPSGIDAELLKRNLSAPQSFVTPAEQEVIMARYNGITISHHSLSIVSFNYTTTIERILNYSGNALDLGPATYSKNYKTTLSAIHHIHGLADDPILGVNDPSQILNEDLRGDVDVQEYLIKPRINSALGHLIDRNARQAIADAHMICVFGLSLGSTDGVWWELVGEKLLRGTPVVLYVYDDDAKGLIPRKIGRYKRLWKTRLCDAAKIPDNRREGVMDRIIVAPNTAVFDIKG